jgi:hypothetical protein
MRRVLKAGGALLERLSLERTVERWQHRADVVAPYLQWLSPRPENRRFDPGGRIRDFGTAKRICPRPRR